MQAFEHKGLSVSFCEAIDNGNAPYPDFITGMIIEGNAISAPKRMALSVNTSKELASDGPAIRAFVEALAKGHLHVDAE